MVGKKQIKGIYKYTIRAMDASQYASICSIHISMKHQAKSNIMPSEGKERLKRTVFEDTPRKVQTFTWVVGDRYTRAMGVLWPQ